MYTSSLPQCWSESSAALPRGRDRGTLLMLSFFTTLALGLIGQDCSPTQVLSPLSLGLDHNYCHSNISELECLLDRPEESWSRPGFVERM